MVGRLIVFEGVEGCGKTTQLQRTREWLLKAGVREGSTSTSSEDEKLPAFNSDLRVIVTREPGGTELGLRLRKLLLAGRVRDEGTNTSVNEEEKTRLLTPDPCPMAELLLYAADRAQHVEEVLKPHLSRGAIVLCDRYTDSTIAYQGYGRRLSLSLIEQLNTIATIGVVSDLTLWLDVDVEVGLARTQKREVTDRIEQSDLVFHQRVQQGYTELALAHSERIVRVDASLSETDVQEQIQHILSQRLKLGNGE